MLRVSLRREPFRTPFVPYGFPITWARQPFREAFAEGSHKILKKCNCSVQVQCTKYTQQLQLDSRNLLIQYKCS